MLHYRVSISDDIYSIKENKYLDSDKDILAQSLNIKGVKAWTVINNNKIVAVMLAHEFCANMYKTGVIVSDNIKYSHLKFLKKTIKEIIELNKMEYVYSEGLAHTVKDRFHEFLNFEIEKDLIVYKKWKYKGLKF